MTGPLYTNPLRITMTNLPIGINFSLYFLYFANYTILNVYREEG